MSLRELKKEKTAQAILDAASRRFAAEGIDPARMEDVAADAEVSVGTLYNYFGSKQALVVALFDRDVRQMMESGSAAVSEDVDPIEAVRHLFSAYLDVVMGTDRALLREVLRFGFGGTEAAGELAKLDERLISQLAGVLAGYQERGQISRTVSIEDAVFLLYSVLIAEVIVYMSVADTEPNAVRDGVIRRVGLVFEGIREH